VIFDILKGAVGGASAGSVFGPWGTGIGALLGGASSAFGGGSGSSGGGGGMGIDMDEFMNLIAPPDYLSSYVEDQFNLAPPFGSKRIGQLENAVDQNKLDKYQLLNLYDTSGMNLGDKAYFDALTDTVGKKDRRELAGVVGATMFGGVEPTRKQIKAADKYAKATGQIGSPKEAQQAYSTYFAQTPQGMANRMPSSQELLAGMKYGPLVGTESGVKLFAGTPRTNEMFDRIDGAKNYRADRFSSIFNT
tara:strand:+ start:154 stop:897 length:744 start_codon:yes stop_codon:yes gene_type:complete